MPEKTVQKEPGKKPAPSKKPKPQQEVVVQIPLSELHPFPDHPFQVRGDASMQETAESVKEYGVLVPALARPREDGGYPEQLSTLVLENKGAVQFVDDRPCEQCGKCGVSINPDFLPIGKCC